ncbi:Insulin-degrading enzyme [Symbiodinium microadriaticum]|uniref:Insulin-degrading enzyme n=1 Tax=Symbiodinium microadriaticum TaxID=2951 RepID=A0A1Q9EKE3_SYMMI|nr:Insulin-degrading enzyme [Symbiodinium microadriaticum]
MTMSAHVVVKNIAGEDVVGQLQFADPPSVDELRKRAAARVPGSRFQLLRGSSVLKEDETVSGGTVERPVLLTLVILPAAGADGGAEVRPLVLEDPISEQMDILVHDMRTGEDSLLPLRYFLAADGKAHLGVLASEAAQMVGADPLAFASLATVSAVFPGEEQTQAALLDSVELWEVIGGAARDGILVRTGWSLSSAELSERLGKGAIIQQKDIRGDRLLYAKVSGSGPREGWVSLRSRGRGLLAKRAARKEPHRAVVKLLHLHTALATASSDWKRRHPVVELIQEICSRLEYLALTALPTDPRAQEAFTEVRDQFSGLWLRKVLCGSETPVRLRCRRAVFVPEVKVMPRFPTPMAMPVSNDAPEVLLMNMGLLVDLSAQKCENYYLSLMDVPFIVNAVKAGSHDDPRQLPGLAHFCEHMLFLGTEKYPENSGFDQFLMKCPAGTEVTVYFAAASSDAAREGLDRFADFFRAPLFKQGWFRLPFDILCSFVLAQPINLNP